MKRDGLCLKLILIAISVIFICVANAQTTNVSNNTLNIADTIKSDETLSIFAKSLKKSGIDQLLEGEGPYTIFVVNNAAYDEVSFSRKLAVWTNKKLMIEILNFHIVKGRLTQLDLLKLNSIVTLDGSSLIIGNDNGIQIDKASLTTADIQASNGIVHIIDTVILPPAS
jgi:uncharacterized surface protein with fasciclin (FAS1) repeats